MKKLKEIKLMVEIAQQGWAELESELLSSKLSNAVSQKKERLKDLLEDIRRNLEGWLCSWDNKVLRDISLKFLEKILHISEKLGACYVIPGYSESFYILDTIQMAKN